MHPPSHRRRPKRSHGLGMKRSHTSPSATSCITCSHAVSLPLEQAHVSLVLPIVTTRGTAGL